MGIEEVNACSRLALALPVSAGSQSGKSAARLRKHGLPNQPSTSIARQSATS